MKGLQIAPIGHGAILCPQPSAGADPAPNFNFMRRV
jgi:hypothetical protein